MTIYSIPAMSVSNEFSDLAFLTKYVEQLVATTGNKDYAVLYEWGEHGPGPFPPLAVLYLVEGDWVRREAIVTIYRLSNGRCEYTWTVEQ